MESGDQRSTNGLENHPIHSQSVRTSLILPDKEESIVRWLDTFRIDLFESPEDLQVFRSFLLSSSMHFYQDTPRSDLMLSKLNIPKHCLNNHQIRQHYLEEYSAKYSKGKYLLSNARKKQRKIIMTYYEEKEKKTTYDQLQMIKQTLIEENDKIKRFKDALKQKLIIYQERIQFLKDPTYWSTVEIQPHSHNLLDSIQTFGDQYDQCSSPDSSTRRLHSQTFDDHLESETLHQDLLDDSFHVNPVLSDKASVDTSHLQLDYLEPNSIPLITEEYYLTDNFWKCQEALPIQNQSNIDVLNELSPTSEWTWSSCVTNIRKRVQQTRVDLFQSIKNFNQKLFFNHFLHNRLSIISTICMIGLTLLFVLMINDLLERFLRYLAETKPSIQSASPSKSSILQLCETLLFHLYHWTISWF